MSGLKGIADYAAFIVMAVILAGAVFLGSELHEDLLEDAIIKENVDVVSDRIAGDVQGLNSYPNGGSLELKLDRPYNFTVSEDPDSSNTYLVNVSFQEATGVSEIRSQNPISLTQGEEIVFIDVQDRFSRICIEKRPSGEVVLQGGNC